MQIWPKTTEVIGLSFSIQPTQDVTLPANYTTHLYNWCLNQLSLFTPKRSAKFQDSQSEKALTISGFEGPMDEQQHSLLLYANQTYTWSLSALSRPVALSMARWTQKLPASIDLHIAQTSVSFKLLAGTVTLPPQTYPELWDLAGQRALNPTPDDLCFTFATPTTFRRKGNPLPLPMPENLFHSYLRRWKDLADDDIDPQDFIAWVTSHLVILRLKLDSQTINISQQGPITGFVGHVQFGITQPDNPEYVQMIYALEQYAPYCGTGHNTAFGFGQTRLGWHSAPPVTPTLPVSSVKSTPLIIYKAPVPIAPQASLNQASLN